jgi:hypothetical protein
MALAARGSGRDTERAMSQENVEIVRREYAAFAARDWAALADLCHPDIEYETLKSAPGVHGCYAGFTRSLNSSTHGPTCTRSFVSKPPR